MSTQPRIGFIGIGLMGHGMAKNLLAKGYPLTFKVNRDRSRLDDLIAAGAKEASSNAGVARSADIVFLCVSTSICGEVEVETQRKTMSAAAPATSTRRWRAHRRKPRKAA